MKIVATRSLPAVDRPNADRWNAARSRQYFYIASQWLGGGSYGISCQESGQTLAAPVSGEFWRR